MASFNSFDAFKREIERFQRELEREQGREIRRKMGKQAQKIARRAAANDLGGDPAFSGWGRLGTKLIDKRDIAILAPASRLDAARWTVAQEGRNAAGGIGGRFQGPGVNMRTGNTSRRRDGGITIRRRGAVRWNGVTAGKNTADDAAAAMDDELPPIAERGVKLALRRHFDVT